MNDEIVVIGNAIVRRLISHTVLASFGEKRWHPISFALLMAFCFGWTETWQDHGSEVIHTNVTGLFCKHQSLLTVPL